MRLIAMSAPTICFKESLQFYVREGDAGKKVNSSVYSPYMSKVSYFVTSVPIALWFLIKTKA
jgi:hypothetical protein